MTFGMPWSSVIHVLGSVRWLVICINRPCKVTRYLHMVPNGVLTGTIGFMRNSMRDFMSRSHD